MCPFGRGAPVAVSCGSAISGLIGLTGQLRPIALSWEAPMNNTNVVFRLTSLMSLMSLMLELRVTGLRGKNNAQE